MTIPDDLIDGVVAGDRTAIGRALTLVESQRAEDRAVAVELLASLMHRSGSAHRVGVTGVPGVGKSTFIVETEWFSPPDEALYGGGEFQNGITNFKDASIQLVQFNTEAIVPFFLSSKGHGILWDNYAWSYLNHSVAYEADMSRRKKTNATRTHLIRAHTAAARSLSVTCGSFK